MTLVVVNESINPLKPSSMIHVHNVLMIVVGLFLLEMFDHESQALC